MKLINYRKSELCSQFFKHKIIKYEDKIIKKSLLNFTLFRSIRNDDLYENYYNEELILNIRYNIHISMCNKYTIYI